MGRIATCQAASALVLAIAASSTTALAASAADAPPTPAAAPAATPATPATPVATPAAAATTPAAAAATAAAPDAASLKHQARDLLDKNQAQAAYQLLAPYEDDLADDPDYDYLLGTAALTSGDPGHAAFALERCLALDPRDGTCRVQMARAHLAMGETERAQAEFDTIKQSSPPPEVQSLVSKYLGSLAAFEQSQKSRLTGYVEGGIGADSNINRANMGTTVSMNGLVPLIGPNQFTLSPGSVQQHASFAQTLAGFNGIYNVNDRWALVADGDFTDQAYQEHARFNNRFGDLSLGGVYKQGASQYALRAQGQLYDVGGFLYRRLWGALAQYNYSFSTTRQLAVYLQSDRLTYPQSGENIHDANRTTLGTAYSTVLAAPFTPAVFAGAYLGQEQVSNSDYKYLGQHFYGLRGGASISPRNDLVLNALLTAEMRNFPASTNVLDPDANTSRKDRQFDFSLGMAYTFSPGFSLRPNVSWTDVGSNTQLNHYKRSVVSLDLRYDM